MQCASRLFSIAGPPRGIRVSRVERRIRQQIARTGAVGVDLTNRKALGIAGDGAAVKRECLHARRPRRSGDVGHHTSRMSRMSEVVWQLTFGMRWREAKSNYERDGGEGSGIASGLRRAIAFAAPLRYVGAGRHLDVSRAGSAGVRADQLAHGGPSELLSAVRQERGGGAV